MDVRRGEIYLVDLGNNIGSVQSGIRPVVIVQNNAGNSHSTTTLVCPLTSKNKKQMPTHVSLSPWQGVERESVALCEQTTVIDKAQIIKRVGALKGCAAIDEINQKILLSFGIERNNAYGV